MCRGIKTIPKPQEFYRAPGSEIPGSVTEIDMILFISYDNGMFLTTVAKYVYMYMYILIINVKTTKCIINGVHYKSLLKDCSMYIPVK